MPRTDKQTNSAMPRHKQKGVTHSHVPTTHQRNKYSHNYKMPRKLLQMRFFLNKTQVSGLATLFIIDITIRSTPFRDIDDFTLSELQGPLIAGSHHINGQLV